MSLTGLYVYPVKSARGITLAEADVVETGLRHDRRWMVVDEAGSFVTQRVEPRLALLVTELTSHELVLRVEGLGEARVPLAAEAGGAEASVTVWDDELGAVVERREASELISDLLGAPRRLVRFPDAGERAVPAGGRTRSTPGALAERVLFADAYPFLLLSQGSLDLLNDKLLAGGAEAVSVARFRPNLVVSGCEPHAEDAWETMTIGALAFTVAKPCVRCSVPSVDPETAALGREPLRTLATYRRERGRVTFGQNLLHHAVGRLRLGDAVSAALAGGAGERRAAGALPLPVPAEGPSSS